jgi:hypothetical protein
VQFVRKNGREQTDYYVFSNYYVFATARYGSS